MTPHLYIRKFYSFVKEENQYGNNINVNQAATKYAQKCTITSNKENTQLL